MERVAGACCVSASDLAVLTILLPEPISSGSVEATTLTLLPFAQSDEGTSGISLSRNLSFSRARDDDFRGRLTEQVEGKFGEGEGEADVAAVVSLPSL